MGIVNSPDELEIAPRQYPVPEIVSFSQIPQGNFAIFVSYNFQCNEHPMSCQQLFPQIELSLLTYGQLSSYIEELASKLSDGKTKDQARKARDQAKRRFQQLGLSKEQADTLIPIHAPGRHVGERDPIKVIAQYIIKNDLPPEEINGIAYDLASSAPTTVAGNSRLNLLWKKLRSLGANYPITEATKIPFITEEANQIQARKHILHGINGYDCPEFFYLEKVQERLNESDVKNLRINRYKPNREVEEPQPFLSMEKNPIQARELLIWIQKSITDKFPFLLKDKDGNTNVAPLNQFLSRHKITSFILRKIGADHASRIHGGVSVDNLYKDVIGKIKCLDLQFQYKGKWHSLDSTEVIDFQIHKNLSFDLVLGQDWLWMHGAKISFGFSSETCSHHAKIVIDSMSILLIEDSNKASS
ncbi:25721_t:CDS:2, partial [Gigaspora margarita]